jgi:hypothetical protein
MPATDTVLPGSIRLVALLAGDRPWLSDATRAEVLSLGAERAGRIVSAIVEEELASPDGDPTALNATILAFALGLEQAIPVLVRCVERLEPDAPLARAAGAALTRMGPRATEALLDAFERAPATRRERIAVALTRTRAHGDRVLDALEGMLDHDPSHGPMLLADYGDPRAIPRLAEALDRAPLCPPSATDPLPNEDVLGLAMAIEELGGALTRDQEAKRAGALRILADGLGCGGRPFTWAGSATRDLGPARPGRNDPCPCGSGKKYKRCHRPEDERAGPA